MYTEMQIIVRDEGSTVIPMFPNDILAARKNMKFDNVASNNPIDGQRLPERWWFES